MAPLTAPLPPPTPFWAASTCWAEQSTRLSWRSSGPRLPPARDASVCTTSEGRVAGGVQIDIGVELPGVELIALEIKASASPKARGARHSRRCDRFPDRILTGAVLHAGPDIRYLRHQNSGADPFDDMGPDWLPAAYKDPATRLQHVIDQLASTGQMDARRRGRSPLM